MNDGVELSILMPCLNEAETLAFCIRKAHDYLGKSGIKGEVVVADNGSTDGSQGIAIELGARVVEVQCKGYGAALMGGIRCAFGRYVIMADADDSYDFSALDPLMEKLREGYDLVVGNRFVGGIEPGAMPPLHRYLGNPVLSLIGRLFFRSPIRDFHCGLRGFSRKAILDLGLVAPGMEFASEMVVKAALRKLRTAEVPIKLYPDGRSRKPHLRSWHDGWRHLRFLLLFSPRWLLLYPGLTLAFLGLFTVSLLARGPVVLLDVTFDVHTMLYASVALIVGIQLIQFSILARSFATRVGLLPRNEGFELILSRLSLERGVFVGLFLALGGFAGAIYTVTDWGSVAFGPLNPRETMRIAIPSASAMAVGLQLLFGGFMHGLLQQDNEPCTPP